VRVRAASLEQTPRWVNKDARVVFPKDAEHFIVPEDVPEGVEEFLLVPNEQVVAA
jgi:hypothetical protein